MYVVHHMSAPPVTVSPETMVPEARNLLLGHNFRHLPVVDREGRLAGVVTDRDIRSAYPSTMAPEEERQRALAALERTPVSSIMSAARATLSSFSTLDDALLLFDRDKVGALPVLDDQSRVQGIFSIRDLLAAYRKLFGLGERGSAMVAVAHDGSPKVLGRLVGVMEAHDIRCTRLAVHPWPGGGGQGEAISLRVHTCNLRAVTAKLTEAGFTVLSPGPAAGPSHRGEGGHAAL